MKRGCIFGASSKAIVAVQTSLGWAQSLPPRPISSERGLLIVEVRLAGKF